MSANEISEIYIPRVSRARQQRWLGLVLMTLLSVFIAVAIVWGVGEAQYRVCVSGKDKAYIAAPGLERLVWPTYKNAVTQQCGATDLLPVNYLI